MINGAPTTPSSHQKINIEEKELDDFLQKLSDSRIVIAECSSDDPYIRYGIMLKKARETHLELPKNITRDRAFIVNSENHWEVCTTSDNGAIFRKYPIRGDGLCGITSAILAHNLLNPNSKIDVIDDVTNSDNSKIYQLKGYLDDGTYCADFTKNALQPVLDNLADGELKNNIIALLENPRDQNKWLHEKDIEKLLKSIKQQQASSTSGAGSTEEEQPQSAYQDQEILQQTCYALSDLLAQDPEMLKLKFNRIATITKINSSEELPILDLNQLFPSANANLRESHISINKKAIHNNLFYEMASKEDFIIKYKPILEKFIEKFSNRDKQNLQKIDGEELDRLVNILLDFQFFSCEKVSSEAKNLIDKLTVGEPKPIHSKSIFFSPEGKGATKQPLIPEKQFNQILNTQIVHNNNLIKSEFAKPLNLQYARFLIQRANAGLIDKKDKPENLVHQIPDEYKNIPNNNYKGWGLKIKYENDVLTLEDDGKINNYEDLIGKAGKIITHINGKLVSEFIKQQKDLQSKTSVSFTHEEIDQINKIPDLDYIVHFFRTTKEDVKLKIDNLDIVLSKNKKQEIDVKVFNHPSSKVQKPDPDLSITLGKEGNFVLGG